MGDTPPVRVSAAARCHEQAGESNILPGSAACNPGSNAAPRFFRFFRMSHLRPRCPLCHLVATARLSRAWHLPPLQATQGFTLFSTAEGGAAYVARDLLDISSHIFKPEVGEEGGTGAWVERPGGPAWLRLCSPAG